MAARRSDLTEETADREITATAAKIKTFKDSRAGMEQGWGGTFEQFAEYLAKQ